MAGLLWFSCWALKAFVPSVPHKNKIAPGPPGCELIQRVKSYTNPSITDQQLRAELFARTCAIV
jgi:hypothetical protein